MDTNRQIVLVGCGNMGAALLSGWLAQGVEPRRIRVVDTQPRALERARSHGVEAGSVLDGAAADVLVLAVKPQQLESLLPACRGLTAEDTLVLSIAAGKPLAFFERFFGKPAMIVRAMPNTPAAIGRGITVLVANDAVGAGQKSTAEMLLRAGGEVVWVDDESLMDAVTAVSGSGPAYVFLLIEALAAAARDVGLDAELAERLATATVAGAGAYAQQAGQSAAALREQVTSPGGTTQAALEVLMGDRGLAPLVLEAVRAATRRGRELA
ncbi:MAG TPA: pyrroline-5-carboxylate reductase [Gammaproteobacteria bacterium]|nr:pyrroline-5-carboxylate reductase [Gammaproteobacteria bacterium]